MLSELEFENAAVKLLIELIKANRYSAPGTGIEYMLNDLKKIREAIPTILNK